MVPNASRDPGAARRARALLWILVAMVVINTAAFASRVANPLVYSDNWTFLDTFLRVAIEDGAGFGDFLVKRAGVDHAQPLGKLLMLANARWFGLDFTLESRVALACALAGWGLILRIAMRESALGNGGDDANALPVALSLAAILAVQLSLGSIAVYAYPMVTMAHAFYLFAFCMLLAAWMALRGRHRWLLALATFACGIVGDDSAILLGAAVAAAALLYAWRAGRFGGAVQVLAIVTIALLACRGVYAAFGEIRGATSPDFNVSLSARIGGLAAQWRDAWLWIVAPLSGGIVSAQTLMAIAGEHWIALRVALALIVACAHVWFWRTALHTRTGAAWFMATGLMLLFYAMVAGILLGRVFVRGAAFLDQGRYVVFYQLGMVALLLMAIAALAGSASTTARRRWTCAAAIAVLLVQIPLSLHAWPQAARYEGMYARMARDMARMARDPLHPPPGCTHGIDICVRPAETRIALMRMLVGHRLNLFSPQFQARHPELAEAAGLAVSDGQKP